MLVLITFKIVDGLTGPILKPLAVDLGLTFSQIGVYITILGAVAALLGAAIAGVLLKYLSKAYALIIFSMLKILSLFFYVYLGYVFEHHKKIDSSIIYAINAFEDACSAMLLVVMLSLIMNYSRKHFAGTDFTLQVSIMATVSGLLYLLSGLLGDLLGYYYYLSVIFLISFICLLPIFNWKKYVNINQG